MSKSKTEPQPAPAVVAEGAYIARFGPGPELPPSVRRHYLIADQVEGSERRRAAARHAADVADRVDRRIEACVMEAGQWAAHRGEAFDPSRWQQYYPSLAERVGVVDAIEADADARDMRKRALQAGLVHLLPGAVE